LFESNKSICEDDPEIYILNFGKILKVKPDIFAYRPPQEQAMKQFYPCLMAFLKDNGPGNVKN